MGVIDYYSLDVVVFLALVLIGIYYTTKKLLRLMRILPKHEVSIDLPRKSIKVE